MWRAQQQQEEAWWGAQAGQTWPQESWGPPQYPPEAQSNGWDAGYGKGAAWNANPGIPEVPSSGWHPLSNTCLVQKRCKS